MALTIEKIHETIMAGQCKGPAIVVHELMMMLNDELGIGKEKAEAAPPPAAPVVEKKATSKKKSEKK